MELNGVQYSGRKELQTEACYDNKISKIQKQNRNESDLVPVLIFIVTVISCGEYPRIYMVYTSAENNYYNT